MIPKIRHDRFPVQNQLALRPTKMQFLQPLEAALNVLLKIPAQGLARDTRQPGNVLVRQPLALQP